jgi:FkbM family methyltransferase
MSPRMRALLEACKLEPVLVDVGASVASPGVWAPIAAASVYLGFDPDLREMTDRPGGRYRRSIVVDEAVTSDPGAAELRFHLTRSPPCSSTLAPDREGLADYHFAGLFEVEREVTVRATTLAAALERTGLARIDWLKCDSQGTDLRIYRSLGEQLRGGLLALDVEPGLIDAYRGEDLFPETHRQIVADGFWLSRLDVYGAVRARAESLRAAFPGATDVARRAEGAIRRSPGWCEARYLRTLQSLAAAGAARERYALLSVFALLDGQPGFALDAVLACEQRFGADGVSARLRAEALAAIGRGRGLRARARAWLARRFGGG